MNNLKKPNVGFAFMVLGLIFAVRQDLIPSVGIVFGIIGLMIIIASNTEAK